MKKLLKWVLLFISFLMIMVVFLALLVLQLIGGEDPRQELLSRRSVYRGWRLVDERVDADGAIIRDIDVEGDSNRSVHLRLALPRGKLSGACLFILGGLETGKTTVEYLGVVPGSVVVGMEYPYEGKKRAYRPFEFIRAIPAINEALLTTPGAAMLAIDYLEQASFLDRGIVLIGGSLGALFVPSIAGLDERVSTMILLFGAADLPTLLEISMRLQDYPSPLPHISKYIATRLLAPLEPVQYMKDMSGKRILMVNGSNDPRMPRQNVEKLYRSISGYRELRWLDVGHVHIKSKKFAELVGKVIAQWLLDHKLITEIPPRMCDQVAR